MKIIRLVLFALKLSVITGLVLAVCIVGTVVFVFAKHDKSTSYGDDINSEDLIKKPNFINLHRTMLMLDSINNIAILPDSNYVVINKVVMNVNKHTFGQEPELGFYNSYYEEGNKNPCTSLNKLLISNNIEVDSASALSVIGRMKKVGISDISNERGNIWYRWKESAIHGEEGIVYSSKLFRGDATRFSLVEPLGNGFYHVIGK